MNNKIVDRTDNFGWTVALRGDNNVDLLTLTVDVGGFREAVDTSRQLVELLAEGGFSDSTRDTQITIRQWRVEITIATPAGKWTSLSQKRFAEQAGRLVGSYSN